MLYLRHKVKNQELFSLNNPIYHSLNQPNIIVKTALPISKPNIQYTNHPNLK